MPSVVVKVSVVLRSPPSLGATRKVTAGEEPSIDTMESQFLASSGISTETPLPLHVRLAVTRPPSTGIGSSVLTPSTVSESTLMSDLLIFTTVTFTSSTVLP